MIPCLHERVGNIMILFSIYVYNPLPYTGPRHDPSTRLTQYCGLFAYEKMDEGYGLCNWKVLEQIWDKSKDINRDRYMLELFRMARNGMLCYAEGARVVHVNGPCEALELACRSHAPKVIDQCWSKYDLVCHFFH